VLFGVLRKLMGRLKPDGSLFLVYFISYSAWRIGIGFLRVGTPFVLGSFIFPFHQAQLIAIIILAVTIPILVVSMRRARARS